MSTYSKCNLHNIAKFYDIADGEIYRKDIEEEDIEAEIHANKMHAREKI